VPSLVGELAVGGDAADIDAELLELVVVTLDDVTGEH
jgi:hypothetical protein